MSTESNLVNLLTARAALVGSAFGEPLPSETVVEAAAKRLVEEMAMDTGLASATGRLVYFLAWPTGGVDVEWWTSEVGRAVVAVAGFVDVVSFSASDAGVVLGLSRARVYQLLAQGVLGLGQGGGVSAESVDTRLRAIVAGP